MSLGDVEPALRAKRAFDDALDNFVIAGVALKLAATADVVSALSNAHDDLLSAESEAVDLHRRAFGRPTHESVLYEACVSAGMEAPRSTFADDNADWERKVVLTVPPNARAESRQLAAAARRLAEGDRLFSVVLVLERLKRLRQD